MHDFTYACDNFIMLILTVIFYDFLKIINIAVRIIT